MLALEGHNLLVAAFLDFFRPRRVTEQRTAHRGGQEEALPDIDPLAETLLENPEYAEHLALMGNDGWELANVQPLLRGVYEADSSTSGGYGYGYSLTAGFYLFWKKEYEKPVDLEEDRW